MQTISETEARDIARDEAQRAVSEMRNMTAGGGFEFEAPPSNAIGNLSSDAEQEPTKYDETTPQHTIEIKDGRLQLYRADNPPAFSVPYIDDAGYLGASKYLVPVMKRVAGTPEQRILAWAEAREIDVVTDVAWDATGLKITKDKKTVLVLSADETAATTDVIEFYSFAT